MKRINQDNKITAKKQKFEPQTDLAELNQEQQFEVFCKACSNGNIAEVESLLQLDFIRDQASQHGNYVLREAARKGHAGVVNLLFSVESVKDSFEMGDRLHKITLIHEVSFHNHFGVASVLMKHGTEVELFSHDLQLLYKEYQLKLKLACEGYQIVKSLMSMKPEIFQDVINAEDKELETACKILRSLQGAQLGIQAHILSYLPIMQTSLTSSPEALFFAYRNIAQRLPEPPQEKVALLPSLAFSQ